MNQSTRLIIRWLFSATLMLPLLVQAAPKESASALDQFVSEVQTLSGRFKQTQTDEDGEILSSGEGRVSISRPGRFRWAYEQPYEQLLVCDGKKIWAYDPDLSQVTVREAREALTGTPAELLAQDARLGDKFNVEVLGVIEGAQHIRLSPKIADSDFKSIDMWLKKGVPQRLRFADPLGGVTVVDLLDLVVNETIQDKVFTFAPPKGTEIIEAAAGQ